MAYNFTIRKIIVLVTTDGGKSWQIVRLGDIYEIIQLFRTRCTDSCWIAVCMVVEDRLLAV